MKRQRIKLSLRIKHPTRDLSSVCQTLGLRPVNIWKAGEERRTPKGNKIGGIREDSRCSIEFEHSQRDPLPKQIEAALMLLQPHRAMLRRLSTTGGAISFYVGWFFDESDGEAFSSELLRTMADLRIALELNIYLPD
jgi:Domain of unknown function (DUF4279)